MAKQSINVGATANDKKGDSLRAAFQKVNANFTELYTALGLTDANLNLGAFEFTGSILSTTDSSSITIDQATTVTSDLTVGGDLLPSTAHGGDLGSSTLPWRSLYVSNNTIFIGGTAVGVDANGALTTGGTVVGSTPAWDSITGKPTFAAVATSGSYADLSNKPTIPTDVGDLTDTGNLLGGGGDGVIEGSIYKINIAGNDSTLLVDSDNGKIVGYVENDRFTVDGNDYQVRIGVGAGATTQGTDAIAIGEGAGNYQQGTRSVAIGRGSGNADQGLSAVGIGFCAGGAEQGDYAVAIGFKAGRGPMAGDPDPAQPNNSIIINASGDKLNGTNSGLYIDPVREDTGNTAKAIYYNTTTKELTYANPTGGGGDGVVEGSIYKINIAGDDSTLLVDSDNGKIVGYVENDQYNYNTNTQSLRIGGGAGETSQGDGAVALGQGAGNYQQENQAVAVGRGSGNYLQGIGAVGIGFCAGATEQGDYAVAIGFKAARGNMDGDGTPNQPANSIMINASSTPLNGDQAGLYINPVREDEANVTKLVYYNTTTKELTYANPTLVSDNDINVTINSADSTSYSWNFNQLGFLEIPNVNNQLGGTIGDTFGDGNIGIKANEAAGSYVELTNRDESAGIYVQGDSTLTGANDVLAAIYTQDGNNGMEFYGDGNAQLSGDLRIEGGIKSVYGIDERNVETFSAGVLTIGFNQRNGSVRNINASGGFPFPPLFTANFTVNLTGFTLQNRHLTTVRVEIEQHSSAGYYPSVLQIDGVAQTIQWEGGVNPAPIGGTRDLAVFYIRNTSFSPTPAYSVIGHYIGGDQTRFDGDVTGSIFADDSTLLVDGVSGKIVGDVSVAEEWKVTVGPDFYTFGYVEGFGSTLGIPGGIRGKLQTALLTGNDIGIFMDGANTPNNVSIGDIANGNTLRIESGSSTGDIILTSSGDIDVRSEGNINIEINLSDSTTRTWRFGEDGDLDTPGGVSVAGILKINDGVHEQFQALADATGVVEHDCAQGHIIYHTSPDDYFTVNLTNLNLASGYATSITVVVEQGATGYGPNALQIGGVAQTINWQGGSLPASPTANGVDVLVFSILNNNGTYVVLAQVTGFNEVA